MKRIINHSLNRLVAEDAYLLLNDTSERSMTHRLGMYLQEEFEDWDVDCEYNKNGSNPKYISIDPTYFVKRMAKLIKDEIHQSDTGSRNYNQRNHDISLEELVDLSDQLEDPERLRYDEEFDVLYFLLSLRDGRMLRKLIVPDIIVHKRGTKINKIVIEAKKSYNNDKLSRAYDVIKLVTLLTDKEYRYEKAYFIDLPVGDDLTQHVKFKFIKNSFHRNLLTVSSEKF